MMSEYKLFYTQIDASYLLSCVGNADKGIFNDMFLFVYCINLVHRDNVDAALRELR